MPSTDQKPRKGFTKQATATVAKDPGFGPGLAGGSKKRFAQLRKHIGPDQDLHDEEPDDDDAY